MFCVITPVCLYLIGCKPAIASLERVLFPTLFLFSFWEGGNMEEELEELAALCVNGLSSSGESYSACMHAPARL